jgi:undecaprenyl-diphosphatase
MLSYSQAIIMGIVQGITELFPISSLGHSVILPKLLGWNINQNDPFFLDFLVATHAATALVLFLFFFNDWKLILIGIFRSLKNRKISESDHYAKLGWLLIIGTVPAGILGIFFEHALRSLFANPQLVAGVLILNGLMLFGSEYLRRNKKEEKETGSDKRIAKLTYMQSVQVGIFQCFALIPGFSRTGLTITGGLFAGLAHIDAARFSFLLATPIIGAAAFLKLPKLAMHMDNINIGPMLIGAVFAGLFAYISVKFLIKYFETKKLWPFAIYCLVVGAGVSLVFLFG